MTILISGKTGYISNYIKNWLMGHGLTDKDIQLKGLRNVEWEKESLKGVDVFIHCAATVHKRKATEEEFIRVNTELTINLARKAKEEGVKQFIFMSTKGVYGLKKNCFHEVIIDESTPINPFKNYGISKYLAEQALLDIQDETFKVAIIRAPFIYGKGCPGNYQLLRKMVLKYRFVPKLASKMSFLYIDNLCELILQIIEQHRDGLYMPQNLPVHSSSEMAYLIAQNNNIRVLYTSIFNPIIRFASLFNKSINSAFGSSYYAERLSIIEGIDYQIVSFGDSIRITES